MGISNSFNLFKKNEPEETNPEKTLLDEIIEFAKETLPTNTEDVSAFFNPEGAKELNQKIAEEIKNKLGISRELTPEEQQKILKFASTARSIATEWLDIEFSNSHDLSSLVQDKTRAIIG